jgi:hypothetical protein
LTSKKQLTIHQQKSRVRVAIEVFGYSWIDLSWIEDNNFDYKLFAAENQWLWALGTLGVSFRIDKFTAIVEFGNNPGRKELRRIAKEIRRQNEAKFLVESNK